MSIQVAFFRNMNLGQARSRSPRSSDLLDAFAAAVVVRHAVTSATGAGISAGPGGSQVCRVLPIQRHLRI